ncbi:hypothetical protein R3P38DRAFT_3365832 [Favolaschia claudopus]|uniref:Ribosomal protein L5 n=1 Tax=Favolaschia claudopus TaxID=2862362 RepID=A0AAW0AEZ4_9AGAR
MSRLKTAVKRRRSKEAPGSSRQALSGKFADFGLKKPLDLDNFASKSHFSDKVPGIPSSKSPQKATFWTRLGSFRSEKATFRTRKLPNFGLKKPLFRTRIGGSFPGPVKRRAAIGIDFAPARPKVWDGLAFQSDLPRETYVSLALSMQGGRVSGLPHQGLFRVQVDISAPLSFKSLHPPTLSPLLVPVLNVISPAHFRPDTRHTDYTPPTPYTQPPLKNTMRAHCLPIRPTSPLSAHQTLCRLVARVFEATYHSLYTMPTFFSTRFDAIVGQRDVRYSAVNTAVLLPNSFRQDRFNYLETQVLKLAAALLAPSSPQLVEPRNYIVYVFLLDTLNKSDANPMPAELDSSVTAELRDGVLGGGASPPARQWVSGLRNRCMVSYGLLWRTTRQPSSYRELQRSRGATYSYLSPYVLVKAGKKFPRFEIHLRILNDEIQEREYFPGRWVQRLGGTAAHFVRGEIHVEVMAGPCTGRLVQEESAPVSLHFQLNVAAGLVFLKFRHFKAILQSFPSTIKTTFLLKNFKAVKQPPFKAI